MWGKDSMIERFLVMPMDKREAAVCAEMKHYLHRAPACSYAFQLTDAEIMGNLLGICTFGVPASRAVQVSVCKSNPDAVIELNRLWVRDECPRNTESYFVARVLRQLPPMIVISYADTKQGHRGYVYRALNFFYAGITDMERKTPRCDYITPGKHSRDTSRNGTMATAERVRRSPKHRYWAITGTRRDRKRLINVATWPIMEWGQFDKEAAVEPHHG